MQNITKGLENNTASPENQMPPNTSWSNSKSNDTNDKKRLFLGFLGIKEG